MLEVRTLITPAPTLTTEEYLRTQESNLPQELAYGVWRVAEAPTTHHQSAVFAFELTLNRLVRRHDLGRIYLSPVDVVLDAGRHLVVQPDLLFVSKDRLAIVRERIWGAPDLVLEVLSPRPRVGELSERLGWFAAYGVRECWLLHQDARLVEVLEFDSGRILDRRRYQERAVIESHVLPGWHHSLADVLEGDD